MGVSPVQSFAIENETDADEYLTDLLAKAEYRSMDEVYARAAKYCKGERVRNYFINTAKEILKT